MEKAKTTTEVRFVTLYPHKQSQKGR